MRGGGTTTKGSAAGIGTKVCPRCGEELFEDMNICYGCLFDFDHEPEVPQIAQVDGLDEDEPWDRGMPPIEEECGMEDTQVLVAPLTDCPLSVAADEGDREWGPDALGVRVASGTMEATVPIGRPVVVGRLPGCAITLRSPAVSRMHLRLSRVSDGVLFEDLGAKNAAMYRGRPIRGQVVLAPGDSVGVCGIRLTVVELGAMDGCGTERIL